MEPGILFSKEKVLGVADEIEPLLRQHYEEVALHQDVVPLDPDWARYVAMEEDGNLLVYTVRKEGRLVGYAVFFLVPHIHYRTTLVASNDILYLHPSCRRGTLALRFIKWVEQQAKACGAKRIMWHVKKENDWSAILHRIDYQTEEYILGKIL